MTAAELVVFVTVAAAVVCWSAAEVSRSRALWTAGASLMVVHAAAAFGVFYDWSHATARDATMRQTATLTGLEFAGGIYVNYLFLAVWVMDAAWWWLSKPSYESRPRWLAIASRGFIFFIMLNGAVVFADGWARVLGTAAVSAALIGAWQHRKA
jgi:hypothetical protein